MYIYIEIYIYTYLYIYIYIYMFVCVCMCVCVCVCVCVTFRLHARPEEEAVGGSRPRQRLLVGVRRAALRKRPVGGTPPGPTGRSTSGLMAKVRGKSPIRGESPVRRECRRVFRGECQEGRRRGGLEVCLWRMADGRVSGHPPMRRKILVFYMLCNSFSSIYEVADG